MSGHVHQTAGVRTLTHSCNNTTRYGGADYCANCKDLEYTFLRIDLPVNHNSCGSSSWAKIRHLPDSQLPPRATVNREQRGLTGHGSSLNLCTFGMHYLSESTR